MNYKPKILKIKFFFLNKLVQNDVKGFHETLSKGRASTFL